MSWSVSAQGSVEEVRGALSAQFKYPLADKPAGIENEGERVTVQTTHDLIEQVLSTFKGGYGVSVTASGYGVFQEQDTESYGYQQVSLLITSMPIVNQSTESSASSS